MLTNGVNPKTIATINDINLFIFSILSNEYIDIHETTTLKIIKKVKDWWMLKKGLRNKKYKPKIGETSSKAKRHPNGYKILSIGVNGFLNERILLRTVSATNS